MNSKIWKDYNFIYQFWEENYEVDGISPTLNVRVGGYCSLCGNKGLIDTRGMAITPSGEDIGKINYCFCPNGIARKNSESKS